MKKLKLFILLFFVAVSLPLSYVLWQTYASLKQEEQSQMRFFSEKIFDQMEKELSEIIQAEENRGVDEYGSMPVNTNNGGEPLLSQSAYPDFILGYLQNNPDGSFQTPAIAAVPNFGANNKESLFSELGDVNSIFNQKKIAMAASAVPSAPASATKSIEKEIVADSKQTEKKAESDKDSFSERYLSKSKSAPSKTYLGKKEQRIEEITAEQVQNIAREDENLAIYQKGDSQDVWDAEPSMQAAPPMPKISSGADARRQVEVTATSPTRNDTISRETQSSLASSKEATLEDAMQQTRFQVEVAPFQSIAIDDDRVYIFRRIVIDNQIYRQGFVLLVKPFFNHLIASHFASQPLAEFTKMQMLRKDRPENNGVTAGADITAYNFENTRGFPAPFDFITVSLRADTIPGSPARQSLNLAFGVLLLFLIVGL